MKGHEKRCLKMVSEAMYIFVEFGKMRPIKYNGVGAQGDNKFKTFIRSDLS